MEKKTIKRMLRERLFHIFYPDQHEENEYIKSRLDIAVTDIKACFTERLPKEQECCCGKHMEWCDCGVNSYNQALALVRRVIEGI